MAGASAETQRVAYVNASWAVGRADAAAFQLRVVTEDPEGATLIAANLVGGWMKPTWSADGRDGRNGQTGRRADGQTD